MNTQERLARLELARHERDFGIYFPGAVAFVEPEWGSDFQMAMDAQPALVTAPSGAAVPAFLTTMIDPQILQIRTAANEATNILDEVRKGDWVDETAIFPIVEHTGEVTAYGDFEAGGRANANTNFETRQSYLFQIMMEYGDRELDRAGRAKINWANELRGSAAMLLGKAENLFYFKGVAGLLNYGIQTDPNLPAPIAPAPKVNGGLSWLVGSAPNASANEIFSDIDTLGNQLITQSDGLIKKSDELVLALSPSRAGALTATNSFAVNVQILLEKNYKRLRIVDAIQYGIQTTQNPQGVAAGEMAQLIAPKATGQDSGWTAFSEKMRAHAVIRAESSCRQKMTSGVWGSVIRQPFAFATMLGI